MERLWILIGLLGWSLAISTTSPEDICSSSLLSGGDEDDGADDDDDDLSAVIQLRINSSRASTKQLWRGGLLGITGGDQILAKRQAEENRRLERENALLERRLALAGVLMRGGSDDRRKTWLDMHTCKVASACALFGVSLCVLCASLLAHTRSMPGDLLMRPSKKHRRPPGAFYGLGHDPLVDGPMDRGAADSQLDSTIILSTPSPRQERSVLCCGCSTRVGSLAWSLAVVWALLLAALWHFGVMKPVLRQAAVYVYLAFGLLLLLGLAVYDHWSRLQSALLEAHEAIAFVHDKVDDLASLTGFPKDRGFASDDCSDYSASPSSSEPEGQRLERAPPAYPPGTPPRCC